MSRASAGRWWFGLTGLLWLVLAMLARADALQAVVTARTLLAWGLVLSYLLFWGWRLRISEVPLHTMFRAIILTVSILSVVAVFEVAAAAGVVHWGAVFRTARGPRDSYMTSFVERPDHWFQRPANAHWTSRPQSDLESRWGLPASLAEPISFTYDARGFRNVETFDSVDVALIGDSYVEGAYVSDDATVASVLGSTLGRPVVNLGVAGFGPSYELAALTRYAAPLRPRVVVWFFFEGNDLYDPDFVPSDGAQVGDPAPARLGVFRRIFQYFGDPRQRRQRGFTYNFLWALSTFTHPILPNRIPDYGTLDVPGQPPQKVYFGDYGGVPWTSYEASRWTEVREFLRSGSAYTQREGIQLLVVFIPTKYRAYRPLVAFPAASALRNWVENPLRGLFADFCAEANLECVDLTEPFRDAIRSGRTPYAIADTHWGPEGHEIVAALTAEKLGQLGWLSSPVP